MRLLAFLLAVCAGCIVTDDTAVGLEEESAPVEPTPVEPVPQGEGSAVVQQIRDGDTIEVVWASYRVAVRLKGIDAPELFQDTPEPFAQDAKDFVVEHMGSTVRLRFEDRCVVDPEQVCPSCCDVYGRVLAYVEQEDGTDVGQLLLEHGLASVYAFRDEHFKRRTSYEEVEAAAKVANVGIWSLE